MDYVKIDDWAKKAQAGDRVAVELLLSTFRPMLLSAANRYQTGRYAFGDALQDMQVAFLEGIEAYNPNHASGFAGFIKGYLNHRPRNERRKRDKQAAMEEPMGDKKGMEGEVLSWIEMIPDLGVDLEQDYVHLEDVQRLRQAIGQLTAEQCRIIEGYYGGGVSLKQLAGTLGMAYSTLQRRHVMVLRRLRDLLNVRY